MSCGDVFELLHGLPVSVRGRAATVLELLSAFGFGQESDLSLSLSEKNVVFAKNEIFYGKKITRCSFFLSLRIRRYLV